MRYRTIRIRRPTAPLAFVLAFALWIALAGCGTDEKPVSVDLGRREPLRIPRMADAISYAYLPQYTHTESYERHHRIVEFLRRETGLNIQQVFPDTFDHHMKMVGEGEIDISYVNPFVYVRLADAYGTRAFARVLEPDGRPRFRGEIIVRADNAEIRTLDDCRGKRWIAVDPGSAGGYLFPLGHFIAGGIRRTDFREIAFAPGPGGKQEKVVMAVHSGAYDIGSIRDGTLDVMAGRIDPGDIRVLDRTPTYPGWLFAARNDLPEAKLAAIRDAMRRLDPDVPEHRPILLAAGIVGIVPATDSDFDPVRELVEIIGSAGLGGEAP